MALQLFGSATCSVLDFWSERNFKQASRHRLMGKGASRRAQGWAGEKATAATEPCIPRKSPLERYACSLIPTVKLTTSLLTNLWRFRSSQTIIDLEV